MLNNLNNLRISYNNIFRRIDPSKRVSKKEMLILFNKPKYYKYLPPKLRLKKLGLSILNEFRKSILKKSKGGK